MKKIEKSAGSEVGLRGDNVLKRIFSPYANESASVHVRPMPRARMSETALGRRSLITAGVGTPTVVFEAGLGKGKDDWQAVFNGVAAKTHAVAYDRAGIGKSEYSEAQRDGQQIVQELRAMLAAEDIPPPYVLVGHSLGGTIVKLFARSYPDEVAGVVLVDARHADLARACRQVGVLRVLYDPPPVLFLMARTAVRRELQAAPTTMRQARRAGPFPSVPLIVLTHRKASTHWPRALGEVWVAGQRNMVSMSSLGRIKVCDESGHNVHRDRPEVVVQAVLNVVNAARYLKRKRGV